MSARVISEQEIIDQIKRHAVMFKSFHPRSVSLAGMALQENQARLHCVLMTKAGQLKQVEKHGELWYCSAR